MITNLHEAVDKLYQLRDHYYDTLSESPKDDQKWELVKKQMTNTVELLKKSKEATEDVPSDIHTSVFYYLLGRAHNVMPDYDSEAQSYLSSAVKLNPSYVEAWNELGECFWKGGDTLSAKNCFSCALDKCRNKVSLRNLSIVLRQLKADSEDRKKLLFEALGLAKEAVQLDPADGKSWLILGNAYFSVAFYSTHSDGYIHKALAAYGQAEKYEISKRNFNTADLCFNKAMALFYDEKYQEALENLECCQKFDPSWELSKTKNESTIKFLLSLKEMVTLKGKLKPRKLNSLLKSINSKDLGPYKTISSLNRVFLQDLVVGTNKGKYILAKVIASVSFDGGSPLACCICDKPEFAAVATIYRLSQDYGLTIGDSLLIPEPQMHMIHISLKNEVVSFLCIRIDSPQLILVNGHTLQPNQMASMFIQFSSA